MNSRQHRVGWPPEAVSQYLWVLPEGGVRGPRVPPWGRRGLPLRVAQVSCNSCYELHETQGVHRVHPGDHNDF